eukprot:COSAG01_NODE_5246_length_4387_cov_10.017724_2_plen_85_part_00
MICLPCVTNTYFLMSRGAVSRLCVPEKRGHYVGLPHVARDRPRQAEPLDAVGISACQAEWEDGDAVEAVPRLILGYQRGNAPMW